MGTVGEKLRQGRESEGLTVRDLSDRTKIRSDHLEALEAGNYDVFSAPVYIRGFVRSIASYLKLDVSEVLTMLDRELSQTERFAEHPKLTQESKGAVDFIMLQLSKINWNVAFPLILLALILLISVFGYRIYRKKQSENPLRDLGPGLYQPKSSGDTLPLPTKTN